MDRSILFDMSDRGILTISDMSDTVHFRTKLYGTRTGLRQDWDGTIVAILKKKYNVIQIYLIRHVR